jgi:hypothetical protein
MRLEWQMNRATQRTHRAVRGILAWLGYPSERSAWVPKTFIPKSGQFTKLA